VTLRDFLSIVEIRTKVVSLTSFGLGTLYAAWAGSTFSWPVAAVMLAAVLCVDMGTTAFNSFFDHERRVDEPERNREEDKVLVHRGVAPGLALVVALALYAAAATLGIVLAALRGVLVIAAGAAGMAVGFLYNGGPRPISRTPLGELFAGAFLGSLLFLLSYYVQARTVAPAAAIVSVPLLLLVASILAVNNTCDIDGDRAAGRRTLSILLGRAGGEALVYVLGGLAYAVTGLSIGLGILPPLALVPVLAAALLTAWTYRSLRRRGFSHATKGPCMRLVARTLALYGGALALSLLLDLLLALPPLPL
jgi:1,4-dihydroxy-2-naphthoate polyprenyltransferase